MVGARVGVSAPSETMTIPTQEDVTARLQSVFRRI